MRRRAIGAGKMHASRADFKPALGGLPGDSRAMTLLVS